MRAQEPVMLFLLYGFWRLIFIQQVSVWRIVQGTSLHPILCSNFTSTHNPSDCITGNPLGFPVTSRVKFMCVYIYKIRTLSPWLLGNTIWISLEGKYRVMSTVEGIWHSKTYFCRVLWEVGAITCCWLFKVFKVPTDSNSNFNHWNNNNNSKTS